MNADSGVALKTLKVDGGMVRNELLMQFQADVLGVPVARPSVSETTALGAAYAAGYAVGFWEDKDTMRRNWHVDKTWDPDPNSKAGSEQFALWQKAVTRTFDWVD
jgi:glycerol kinase